jgi:hypothetical protein
VVRRASFEARFVFLKVAATRPVVAQAARPQLIEITQHYGVQTH